jgi:hypothetical protein
VRLGDLVKSKKNENSIGIVMEIFDDLDEDNPWVRVLFTNPTETYRWCKRGDLTIISEDNKKEEDQGPPLSGATYGTGSL